MSQNTHKNILLPGIVGVVLTFLFVVIVGGAFHTLKPNKLPLAVVAPQPMVAQLQQAANSKSPNSFTLKSYQAQGQAITNLKKQKVYGVVTPGQDGIQLTIASANGDGTNQAITGALTGLAAANHEQVRTTDINAGKVGHGTPVIMLFLFLGGVIAVFASQIAAKRVTGVSSWSLATAISAILIGLGGAIAVACLGELRGAFWGTATILAVASLVNATIIGALGRLFGKAGLGLSALLLIPFGVATTGAIANYHFLPSFYRGIAPWMTSQATVDSLRQVAFMDNASLGHPFAVFAWWFVAALVVFAVGGAVKGTSEK